MMLKRARRNNNNYNRATESVSERDSVINELILARRKDYD